MAAFLHFANTRRRAEAARDLSLHALAARGEPRELKKQLKELERDQ